MGERLRIGDVVEQNGRHIIVYHKSFHCTARKLQAIAMMPGDGEPVSVGLTVCGNSTIVERGRFDLASNAWWRVASNYEKCRRRSRVDRTRVLYTGWSAQARERARRLRVLAERKAVGRG